MANLITITSILIASAHCVPVHDFSHFYRNIEHGPVDSDVTGASTDQTYRNEMVNMVDDMARHYGGRPRHVAKAGHVFVPDVIRPKKVAVYNKQHNQNLRRKMFSRFHRRH